MEQQDHLEPELDQDELQVISGGSDNSTAAAIGVVGAGLVAAQAVGAYGKIGAAKQLANIAEYGVINRAPPAQASRSASSAGGGSQASFADRLRQARGG